MVNNRRYCQQESFLFFPNFPLCYYGILFYARFDVGLQQFNIYEFIVHMYVDLALLYYQNVEEKKQ